MILSVSRYASSTHSTIFSGCGEYSSSMLTVRLKPVSRMALRYSLIGGRRGRGEVAVHLAVAVAQVDVGDAALEPLPRSNGVRTRSRWEMSQLASTLGRPTSSMNLSIVSTLIRENLNGSSSIAISSPRAPAYSPSRSTFPTARFHCSAGGMTCCSQMYSPQDEQEVVGGELLAHVQVLLHQVHAEPLDH